MSKISYEEWMNANKNALKNVYTILNQLCQKYGLFLINSNESYQFYLKMMYYESSKVILDPILYSEFYT